MSCYLLRLSLLAGLWAGVACQVGAQESKEPAPEAAKSLDIPKLIKQLDSEDFSERQSASAKLAGAAESAIPALEKAAQSDSRETSMRAFDILKGHFEKGGSVRDAAKQALERIAKADAGAASRRANEVLTPPTPVTPPRNVRAGFAPVPGFAPAPGGIRIAGARVVIAAAAGGGGVETKIQVENGVKTTEVKDKDRKVKIVDDPDKGLQLEVTETKDGKETTQKYEAKNADELKTKNAEAHKIYEQYSQKGAEIKIGGFGIAPGFAPVPAAPAVPAIPLIPVAPAIAPRRLIEDLRPAIPMDEKPAQKKDSDFEGLEKAIQDAEASLKEAIKQTGDSEQLKKAQERLAEVRKQLEQLRSSLK